MQTGIEALELLASKHEHRWRGTAEEYQSFIQSVLSDVLLAVGEHCDMFQKHGGAGKEAQAFNDGVICCTRAIMNMSSDLSEKFSAGGGTGHMPLGDA